MEPLIRGGGRNKWLTCLPLNTPLYITLTMILYENMKPIEHFCFIRCAYFLTWCAHGNTVMQSYLYIIKHIEVADEFIASKNTDLTRFFIIKPRQPGRLKKQIWVKKKLTGSPGHICGKAPATVTWSRVARSTSWQGAKSSPEKSQILRQGPKKGQLFFPNLSAVTKSYEPILRNLFYDNVPQSQLQHNSKTITWNIVREQLNFHV